MDDIVTRLRMWGGDPTTWQTDPVRRIEDGVSQEMLHEAADEIERLRAALDVAQSSAYFWEQETYRRG